MNDQQVDTLEGTSKRAFCTGYVQLYFDPLTPNDPGLVWPKTHEELHTQLAPIVQQVMQAENNMNTVVAITKASVHNMPEDGDLAHEVNLHFQASLVDGPAEAIDNLKASGATLPFQFRNAMAILPWAAHVSVHLYVELVYTEKVSGQQVVQRIGTKRGTTQNNDGTEPVELEKPVDIEDTVVGADTPVVAATPAPVAPAVAQTTIPFPR